MDKQRLNNIRLGIFVLAGLTVLVVSLYVLGKNQNLFGTNFVIKARFKNISGLTTGNNVRFSGIDAGTVKTIHILSDTSIEITLVINNKLQSFIHKNAIVDIGNEGLMGNKVVNITPNNAPSPPVEDGELLQGKPELNTGSMLETFSHTNSNVEVISGDLRVALRRLNESRAIWSLLEDSTLTNDIRKTLSNFRKSSETFSSTATDVKDLIQNIKKGEGVAGTLLADKKEAENIKQIIEHLKKVSENTEKLTARTDSITKELQHQMRHDHGAIQTLLSDTAVAGNMTRSMRNLEQSSALFKEEMQALKQNKFLKKYLLKELKNKK